MTTISGGTARGVALVLVWSSGFIGAELGAPWASPGTLLAWRALLVALLLAPWLGPALRSLSGRDWVRQGVIALLCEWLYLGGLFEAGAAGGPPAPSALVASLQPALVLALTALGGSGRVTGRQVVGLGLGSAGVAVAAAGDLSAGTALLALLLPFGAMLALTAGTLLHRRWSHPGVGLLPGLAAQSLFTAGFFTAGAAAAGELVPPVASGFWVAVTWAVLAGLGSYACYYLVTARDGAARASSLLYLTPAVTALWAVPMLGHALTVPTGLGLALALGGVILLRENEPRDVGIRRTPRTGPTPRSSARGGTRRGAGEQLRGEQFRGHLASLEPGQQQCETPSAHLVHRGADGGERDR